jgi:hypothetical protein
MNGKYTVVAMSALALGAVAVNSYEASARVPDESRFTAVGPHDPPVPEYNYPNYEPQYEVPRTEIATDRTSPDRTATDALQAGASALGGAGVGLGGLWLYRRLRHTAA